MVEAVCFDLDGTLFDDRQYVEAGLRAAARVVEAETGEDVTRDLFEAFFGDEVREQTFDHVLGRRGLPTDLVAELVEAYHDHDAALDPYPEAVEVLDRLRREYRLGLLTGGTNGHDKIDRLGLKTYFDAIVVAPACGLTKREPEVFVRLLEELDVAGSEAVYVGDRPRLDVPQPNRLGMHTVWVRTGLHGGPPESERERPDRTVESLDRLPDVLETLE